MNAPADIAQVIASQPDATLGYRDFTPRQLQVPARRILRPHHLDHARRPAA